MPSCDGDRALVEAIGLRRSFGRVRVLHDVGLRLNPGEVLAIAGPNGSGKTTLLRLLAGIMRPDSGEIRVLGRLLGRDNAEARRSIGLLLHHSLLYDDLTLAENLSFAARLYGISPARGAALAALEEAGLGSRAHDLPRRLSRGLLQRAAIARALLHRPPVLLLDEPFTGLDAGSAESLRSDLRRRTGDGHGVVVVTHHLAEIWPLATRVAVLVEGRWVSEEPREGPLETFLPRYQGLIGA
jgi:heme ABC exporter ATP-binding subunit CcmA